MTVLAKFKKQQDAPKGSPAWMSTFSDLMNLLLCFFVLLFSMSSVDAEKYAAVVASLNSTFSIFNAGGSSLDNSGQLISSGVSQLNALDSYTYDTGKPVDEDSDSVEDPKKYMEKLDKEAAQKLYESVTQVADKENVDSDVEITMDSSYQYVKITLGGAVLFDSGDSQIKSESEKILNKIGNILKNYDKNLIKIEGHTDNVPVSRYSNFKDNMELSSARAYSVWDYMIKTKHLNPKTLEASGRSEYNPVADNSTSKGRAKNRRVEFKIYTENYIE